MHSGNQFGKKEMSSLLHRSIFWLTSATSVPRPIAGDVPAKKRLRSKWRRVDRLSLHVIFRRMFEYVPIPLLEWMQNTIGPKAFPAIAVNEACEAALRSDDVSNFLELPPWAESLLSEDLLLVGLSVDVYLPPGLLRLLLRRRMRQFEDYVLAQLQVLIPVFSA